MIAPLTRRHRPGSTCSLSGPAAPPSALSASSTVAPGRFALADSPVTPDASPPASSRAARSPPLCPSDAVRGAERTTPLEEQDEDLDAERIDRTQAQAREHQGRTRALRLARRRHAPLHARRTQGDAAQ